MATEETTGASDHFDKKVICKLLLDQFNKIFSTPNVENRVNDTVSYFAREMGSLTPQLSNITIDKNKIIEAIHDLSTHSAPGPDGVPAIVFKECAEALSEPLMILPNAFFDWHYIPDILKRAAIVPVYYAYCINVYCRLLVHIKTMYKT